MREIDALSQQYASLKTKMQALGPEELVFRQPDDYSMTYRGSSLRGEPTLCADYMRRCGRHTRSSCCRTARREGRVIVTYTTIHHGSTVVTRCHMHMHMHMHHRSGQLRGVLRPKKGAADGDGSDGDGSDGDGSTGEGADGAECAASSLHALHKLWNVQHEHAAEVQPWVGLGLGIGI